MTILTLLFIFFFRKIFMLHTTILLVFVYFFFRKIVVPFYEAFLKFFHNILLTFLYIGKKYKSMFYQFLYVLKINVIIWVVFKFVYQNFLIRIFFIKFLLIRIKRIFYVVNNILWHHIYILLKALQDNNYYLF